MVCEHRQSRSALEDDESMPYNLLFMSFILTGNSLIIKLNVFEYYLFQ